MLTLPFLPASGSWAVMWCNQGAHRSILSDTGDGEGRKSGTVVIHIQNHYLRHQWSQSTTNVHSLWSMRLLSGPQLELSLSRGRRRDQSARWGGGGENGFIPGWLASMKYCILLFKKRRHHLWHWRCAPEYQQGCVLCYTYHNELLPERWGMVILIFHSNTRKTVYSRRVSAMVFSYHPER